MNRNCPISWIDSYLEYTKNQESPTAFHSWVALSILGAVIGRNVWLRRVKYTIYPNMFVILVAGSARCKKSSSINIGINLLRQLKEPPMLFAQKITNEALIQALEEAKKDDSSSGLICASELSVFMGVDAIRSGIIPTLTDLYDSPKEWTYHTRGRGKEVLRNVTLSMLAASTKDWLKTAIPVDAVGGGFTSRIVFIFQDEPSKLILFPVDDPQTDKLQIALIKDLETIQNMCKGPMTFTPEAIRIATEWYHAEHSKPRESIKLDGYFNRKHDTMFKIATILSIAEKNDLIIDNTHIRRALSLLKENEKALDDVISSVATTVIGETTEKVFELIRQHETISHTKLLQKCWRFAKASEISDMLQTLIEGGEIKQELSTNNKLRFYTVLRK